MLPIHFAAWFNRLDVAALLLDKGSMVNPPTKVGKGQKAAACCKLASCQPYRDCMTG